VNREILLSTRAQQEFGALGSKGRARVRSALESFAATGRGDLKKLKGVHGGSDLYRLRAGEYRIVFELAPNQVRVTRIVPRSAGYDWL
jgi:mRNA interferase RelE/StbE